MFSPSFSRRVAQIPLRDNPLNVTKLAGSCGRTCTSAILHLLMECNCHLGKAIGSGNKLVDSSLANFRYKRPRPRRDETLTTNRSRSSRYVLKFWVRFHSKSMQYQRMRTHFSGSPDQRPETRVCPPSTSIRCPVRYLHLQETLAD